MRSPDDICLLCESKKATKENSHIIPKFMGKSLLGLTGTKRAYILDTDKGHLPADFTQDIAKENYLFCPDCESYFSFMETYIAERLHKRLWTARLIDQFPYQENGGGVGWKTCLQVDPTIFRLFIYSILFRCSVSSVKLHDGFKLEAQEHATLKDILIKFISPSYKEFIHAIANNKKNISAFPFVLYTSKTFENPTTNTIFTSTYNKNPYVLHLNEYILIFSFVEKTRIENFDFLVNNDLSPVKVGFFSEDFWLGENKRFFDQTLDIMNKKTKAAGKELYIDPKFKKDK